MTMPDNAVWLSVCRMYLSVCLSFNLRISTWLYVCLSVCLGMNARVMAMPLMLDSLIFILTRVSIFVWLNYSLLSCQSVCLCVIRSIVCLSGCLLVCPPVQLFVSLCSLSVRLSLCQPFFLAHEETHLSVRPGRSDPMRGHLADNFPVQNRSLNIEGFSHALDVTVPLAFGAPGLTLSFC